MKALMRENEIMTEPFTDWVKNHMNYLIEYDGWTLIEDYITEEEP